MATNNYEQLAHPKCWPGLYLYNRILELQSTGEWWDSAVRQVEGVGREGARGWNSECNCPANSTERMENRSSGDIVAVTVINNQNRLRRGIH